MVLSKTWRLTLLVCVCGATALKLFLALKSSGTLDVFAFGEFLTNIREVGGIGAYYRTGRAGNPFNHPPFMIHAISSMGFLADITPLPFRFWLRLPAILADLGNLFLVWKIIEHTPSLRLPSATLRVLPLSLVLLAVYPGSILISGFHGNTDPLMIFFVVLSIYLLTVRRLAWLAGAAFGMAVNIKIVPLVFAPAIFLFLPDLQTRLKFFASAATVFFVGSLPYLLQDPLIIWKTVFGYKSLYGAWGWTRLVVKLTSLPRLPGGNAELVGAHAWIAAAGRFVMFAAILAASFRMNLRRHKSPLFLQCALIAFLFLFLTPGFGTQYLAWLVPFVVVLGAWSAGVYYFLSACYLTSIYWSVSFAARRVLDVKLLPANFFFVLELACWLSILFALVSCWRLLRNYSGAGEENASKQVQASAA